MGLAAWGFMASQPAAGAALFLMGRSRRCSGRSSTPTCRSTCAMANWSAATVWSNPAPFWPSWADRSSVPGWSAAAPGRRHRRRGARARCGGLVVSRGIPLSPPPEPERCGFTGIRSPKPATTCASPPATAPCGCRCSAFRGSGSTAPRCWRSFPAYASDVLGGGEGVFILLLAVFSVGVGAGSLALREAVRRQGGNRSGAVRRHRSDAVRHRPVPRQHRRYRRPHDGTVGGFLMSAAHWRLLPTSR
jgi:hypothetical protein